MPNRVMRLLREKLDALADPLDPGFGFDLIRLEAMLTERTEAAIISFDSNENAGREIAVPGRPAVRRAMAKHRVLRFVPQDTHIPEAQSAAIPAQDRDFVARRLDRWRGQKTIRRCRPLRLFEKPEEITRHRRAYPMARPCAFAGGARHLRSRMPKGRNASPWNGGESEKPTRDYFRVETRDGQRFWLYRDGLFDQSGLAPRWYLHGIFA